MIVAIRLALLLIGFLVGQVSFAQEQLTGAAITEASGEILVQIGNEEPQPWKPGQPLQPGMTLLTRPGASAVIVYPDGQIIALGEGAILRNTNYIFDPKNTANSVVNVNLVSGNMRFVAGEIAQTNPQAVRVQAGMATLGIVPSALSGVVDANIVVQGGSLAITLQGGRATVNPPVGEAREIGVGQGLSMGQSGSIASGPAAQILQAVGQLPGGANLLQQMSDLQGFSQKILFTSATAASITAALKNSESIATARMTSGDALAEEILKQLASLSPPASTLALAQVLLPAFLTPPTGAGGSSRPASPN